MIEKMKNRNGQFILRSFLTAIAFGDGWLRLMNLRLKWVEQALPPSPRLRRTGRACLNAPGGRVPPFVNLNRSLRSLFAFANYRSLRSRVFLVANDFSNGWKREPTPPGGTPPAEGIFTVFGKKMAAGSACFQCLEKRERGRQDACGTVFKVWKRNFRDEWELK